MNFPLWFWGTRPHLYFIPHVFGAGCCDIQKRHSLCAIAIAIAIAGTSQLHVLCVFGRLRSMRWCFFWRHSRTGASWSLCIKNSVEASGKREVQTARDPFWSRMGGSGRATKQRRHLSVSVRWTTKGPRTPPPPPSKPQAAGECHEVRHHVPQFSVLIGSSDVRLGGADRKKKAAFLPFTICYWGLGACRPPSLPSPSQSGG